MKSNVIAMAVAAAMLSFGAVAQEKKEGAQSSPSATKEQKPDSSATGSASGALWHVGQRRKRREHPVCIRRQAVAARRGRKRQAGREEAITKKSQKERKAEGAALRFFFVLAYWLAWRTA